jgi:hypothetical protein
VCSMLPSSRHVLTSYQGCFIIYTMIPMNTMHLIPYYKQAFDCIAD